MKRSQNKSSFFRQLPLMVAMLAAFVFSVSSGLKLLPSQYQEVSYNQQAPEQEKEQGDERPSSYIDYACNALTPAAQLLQPYQPVFQAFLPPPADVEEERLQTPSLGVNPYFITLFRRIISPNAP